VVNSANSTHEKSTDERALRSRKNGGPHVEFAEHLDAFRHLIQDSLRGGNCAAQDFIADAERTEELERPRLAMVN
jgi:hypothetical protein